MTIDNIIKALYEKIRGVLRILRAKKTTHEKLFSVIRSIIESKRHESFFFVQIGSHDGKTNDWFFKLVIRYKLSGILVEPVKYLFERLKKNYTKQEFLFFENVAIGNPNQHLKFYRLKETPGLIWWYDQLGSFKKDVILKHSSDIQGIENLIIEEDVQVITFNQLLKKYNLDYLSFLIIDTEGYDAELITSIDFTNCNIENILFENKHLQKQEYQNSIDFLKKNGFKKFVLFDGDTLCSK